MTREELSQIEEENIIYDESDGTAYYVIKVCKSGILTYNKWTNSYGEFIGHKFLINEDLLCKDMILLK